MMHNPMDQESAKPSWIVLPAHSGHTSVFDFFCQHFPHISSADWQMRFAAGLVRDTAGQPIASERTFSSLAKQKLSYFRAVQAEQEIPFKEEIVFQDEHILVADKPHFLPVQPAGRYLEQTLLTRLQRHCNLPELAPAHRIDQGTAGLVLLIKQPAQRGAYQQLFRDREIEKTYHAIAPFRAELTFPMLRKTRLVDGAHFMQMAEVDGVANSETEISLLQHVGDCARYQLKPYTGKRHQLRVQMSALGIPIQNDPIYPQLLAHADTLDFTRPLKLLAYSLTFQDPVTGQARYFASNRSLC